MSSYHVRDVLEVWGHLQSGLLCIGVPATFSNTMWSCRTVLLVPKEKVCSVRAVDTYT
jgi:hypothetical protein